MANYAKLQIKAVLSKNSDYSEPTVIFNPAPYEPASANVLEYFHTEIQCDLTGDSGTILDTQILDGASFLVIKNLDSTNFVTVSYDNAGAGGADQNIRIAAGGLFAIADFNVDGSMGGLKITADTAVCQCEIFVVGT